MSKTYRNVKGQKVKEGLVKGKKHHSKYFRRKKIREDELNGSISSGNRSNLNDNSFYRPNIDGAYLTSF